MSIFSNSSKYLSKPKKSIWTLFRRRRRGNRLKFTTASSNEYRESTLHLDNDGDVNYIQVGTLYSDIKEQEKLTKPEDKRYLVVRWIWVFVIFWVIFRFVKL